ncbi:type 4 pilus major pilin [Bordetella petrii]|uniref:type 4 pilus major pilin n=1 Tax=Bordetella petrii TaxID=94624 RepID=UPI001A964923|nr:type 4 pilus major pilin [Bordetella petrii]MBO1110720.1 prepilin-type N-terminal cleavage/methylation domain-containing protein [Bordetella petrii]
MPYPLFIAAPRRQAGFSLIEVSIVTAIVLLVAIIGIPAIGAYVIENKVPKVGEELQRFVARTKTFAQGSGPAPYADLDTGSLANALRDSSVVAVSGTGASSVVSHGLGGSGSGGNGTITIAPVAVAGGGAGSGFAITLTNVSNAACPGLASVMQRVSDIITIEGRGGASRVKDTTIVPRVAYSAVAAESQCAEGDSNTFVFTVR